MTSITAEKNVFKIIAISNVIFILLFIVLSYFNRIAADDFYAISFLKEHGIIESLQVSYHNWSGRWLPGLLNLIVIHFYTFKLFLFVYGLFVISLFIFSVNRFLHNIMQLFRWTNLIIWRQLHISIFIISAIFYSSIRIDETWFWLSSTCIYLMSIIFLFLGTSSLISVRSNILNSVLLIISFIHIGGSCEPFALIVILFLIVVSIADFLKIIDIRIPKYDLNKRLITAFICCISSFIFSYLANGNRIRESFFHEIGLWQSVVLNIKTTGMIILLRLPYILPFVVLFSLPTFYYGSVNSKQNINKKTINLRMVFILIIYFSSLYIYQLPITYITQDIGAYRTLFPITLFSLLAGAGIFYNYGLLYPMKTTISKTTLFLSLIIILCLNIYTLIVQLMIVPKYAQAFDKRILFVKHETSDPIIVEPLPKSGLLFSAEISTDPTYFTNQHFKKGLGIKNNVIVSKK